MKKKKNIFSKIESLILEYQKESLTLACMSPSQARADGMALGLQMAYDLLKEETDVSKA